MRWTSSNNDIFSNSLVLSHSLESCTHCVHEWQTQSLNDIHELFNMEANNRDVNCRNTKEWVLIE